MSNRLSDSTWDKISINRGLGRLIRARTGYTPDFGQRSFVTLWRDNHVGNHIERPKSLVTGGAGFIGSHVADELLLAGHKVVALDDLSGGFVDNISPQVEFVKGSITDVALVDSLFDRHRFDYVFHIAAYAAEGLSHFIRRFNYTNNLLGSVTLINAAVRHHCRSFVFTSSIAVYGAGQTPMTEGMTPAPEHPYGISKFAVEMDLEAAHRLFGLNYIVFRPHNVYGERQNVGDKYRNVIGIFMNQVMQGPRARLWRRNQTRPSTFPMLRRRSPN